jgi:PKD repeat protein
MNLVARSRSLKASLALPLAVPLFLIATLLSAQVVPVPTAGLVGITTGVPPKYSGPYVVQQTEYGFFWLDTVALNGGHVQAVSKCVGGFPPSTTGIYVLADCNSITAVLVSSTQAQVLMTSSQCGAQSIGCGGRREDGHWVFTFGLGSWGYLPDEVVPIAVESTQTTDPLGRRWSIRPADSTFRYFTWTVVSGGTPPTATSTPTAAFTPTPTPTPTPGPGVRAVNLSSQARGDSVNYFGDKWQLDDISNPSPTNRTDWDFIYNGSSFQADEGGTPGPPDNKGTVIGYFPCDPNGPVAGTFRFGANCIQSVGLTNPPPTSHNYQFAMLSSVSATPLVSTAYQVNCPQVSILGYAGSSGVCAKTGGTLTVVRGGVADARASLGNLSEASFDWTFPGTATPNVSGQAPSVPAGATTFTLTITFVGGYQATASGSITIVDSTPVLGIFTNSAATVPAFFFGGTFQLTAGTTYYLKDTETSAPPSAHFYFNNGSGDVELSGSPTSGPGPLAWTPGSVCTAAGCLVKITVGLISSSSRVVISSAGPAPTPTPPPSATPPPGGSITVSVSGPASGSRGVSLNYTASASGGSGSYSYGWNCSYNGIFPSFSPGASTTTCSYSGTGIYTVAVRVTDTAGASTVNASTSVSIVGAPAPSSQYAVSGPTLTGNLSGGYSASNGSPVTFTANEPNATYLWDFGDGTSATTRTAVKTYSAAGAYSVRLTLTGDGVNTSGTASTTIPMSITGPPLPSTAYTVTGATQTGTNAYTAEAGRAISFAATATQASAFLWDFGDETKPGKSVSKTFSTAGAHTARLTVTGDGTNTVGTANVDIAMTITPPSFRAVIVPGVAHLDDGSTTWGTDVSITNGGSAAMNISLAFVPFSDSGAPSLDLTQLIYGPPIALSPGASHSVNDVVAFLNGGNNKGTVVIKYVPGTRAPLVSARVYFQPKVNPLNVSYGSGIPVYSVDGSGGVSPQGFVSVALSAPPSGLGTESIEAATDLDLTVTPSGTGSGTVTSEPAGINCPPTCSANFPAGSSVVLTGAASPGSTFYGFISGCDSSLFGNCQVTMFSTKTVTARFDSSGPAPPTNYLLAVTRAGAGSGTVSSTPAGISCGATCSASFPQATAVTLTASPDAGSSFSGWSGACSGTGPCSLTMSADQSATATFTAAGAPAPPSGDQYLIGLQSDSRYRFVVTLFNAGAIQGNFELRATDDRGALVSILDASGSLAPSRKFSNLGPYQQVYLRDTDLFLESDLGSGKHYVLKATSTKGTLLAFGTALDRKTLDLVQISDDSQASPAENESVSYWVAGVSRYDTTYGAHWRTDLRIFNRSSRARNLSFQYSFTADGVTEHVAQVANLSIAAGQLLTYDDVVDALLKRDTTVDLSGSNAGILRIFYPEDDESAARPLIIGSRNYNDDPTGTAGSQLSVYTNAQAGSASRDLFLTGVEESSRYSSRIGVFAMDPGPVTGRIVAVAPDGSEVGSAGFTLGGTSPHYGQISLTDSNMNFTNPGKPVSIRFEQLNGGRIGAYAFTVDKVTLDTNFIQGLPQN